MKNFFCVFLAASFVFVSCADNLFESVLYRTADDPFCDTPNADSLSLEHTVYLSWKQDAAADIFRLMRSYDQKTLRFSCIYEGEETMFTDTDITDGNRYVYRLDKIRGTNCFEGKAYAFGYDSDCRKDDCEPNNAESDATPLEHDFICNLPCVTYITDNLRQIDADWFCVTIPPCRAAEIVISQHNLSNESVGADTSLVLQVAGSESEAVRQKVARVIPNTSFATKNVLFKIFPETTGLFSENSSSAIIEYTVSLSKIYTYSL